MSEMGDVEDRFLIGHGVLLGDWQAPFGITN
jgi:hypothetical protein